MRNPVFLLLFLVGCGFDSGSTSNSPSILAQPDLQISRCAESTNSGYYDTKLGTFCTFGNIDGHYVCLPNNMPRVISGMCNPKGGPDRIWIDRTTGCQGDGSARYAVSTNTKICTDLKGPIEIISLANQSDQNIYLLDPNTKSCIASGLIAKSTSPIVDREPTPSPIYLYAADFPNRPCPLK